MATDSYFQADLRDCINSDPEAQCVMIWNGASYTGSKADLELDSLYDNDGGGYQVNRNISGTFCYDDFEIMPVGQELVILDGFTKRIKSVTIDDLKQGLTIVFEAVNK